MAGHCRPGRSTSNLRFSRLGPQGDNDWYLWVSPQSESLDLWPFPLADCSNPINGDNLKTLFANGVYEGRDNWKAALANCMPRFSGDAMRGGVPPRLSPFLSPLESESANPGVGFR